jgi:hypothetical protein
VLLVTPLMVTLTGTLSLITTPRGLPGPALLKAQRVGDGRARRSAGRRDGFDQRQVRTLLVAVEPWPRDCRSRP